MPPLVVETLRQWVICISPHPQFALNSRTINRGRVGAANDTSNPHGAEHVLQRPEIRVVVRREQLFHRLVGVCLLFPLLEDGPSFPERFAGRGSPAPFSRRFSFVRMEMLALSKREIGQLNFARIAASMKSHCRARGTVAITSK